MKFANRTQTQADVPWATAQKLIAEKRAQGIDVIRISAGDPDLPTPDAIVETLRESVQDPAFHRYPFGFRSGLNEAIASWYQTRFGVTLDPSSEVVTTSGSQEGIGTVAMTIMEPGAIALVTDPAYGSYVRASKFAGGDVYAMPIGPENDWLPDLDAIPPDVLAKARLLWINYPNNPTGAIAPLSFFEKVVAFAKEHDIIVCHDTAYSEITYDGYVAPSFLAVEGAKDVGIELNTISKAYNMAGWRVGMAAGNAQVLDVLRSVLHNTSMGLFGPVQHAAVEALTGDQSWLVDRNKIYEARRNIVVEGFRKAGLEMEAPKATLYVWAKLPSGFSDSLEFSSWLLDEASVWITAGLFFGEGGSQYVRATLTLPDERLQEAVDRMVVAMKNR